jgi:hypothetical protein
MCFVVSWHPVTVSFDKRRTSLLAWSTVLCGKASRETQKRMLAVFKLLYKTRACHGVQADGGIDINQTVYSLCTAIQLARQA